MAQAAKHLRKNKDLEAQAEQERKEKEEKKEEERAKRRSRSRDKKRKVLGRGENRTCCKHTLVHVRRKEGEVQPNEDACVDQTAFEFHISLMQAKLISVGHEPDDGAVVCKCSLQIKSTNETTY
ncbi:hypothetical protein AOLI_G00276990 [Acnodon oligacanthus]